MTLHEIAGWRPLLYHVLPRAVTQVVCHRGLLSAEQLVRAAANADGIVEWWWGDEPDDVRRSPWRDLNRSLRERKLGFLLDEDTVALRDQHALGGPNGFAQLGGLLQDGLHPKDWLEVLNGRVFLFPCRGPADNRICEAGTAFRNAYAQDELTTLTIETARIPPSLFNRIELSTINGGAINGVARRGLNTYLPPHEYHFVQFRDVREIAVRECATVDELDACCISPWFRQR